MPHHGASLRLERTPLTSLRSESFLCRCPPDVPKSKPGNYTASLVQECLFLKSLRELVFFWGEGGHTLGSAWGLLLRVCSGNHALLGKDPESAHTECAQPLSRLPRPELLLAWNNETPCFPLCKDAVEGIVMPLFQRQSQQLPCMTEPEFP